MVAARCVHVVAVAWTWKELDKRTQCTLYNAVPIDGIKPCGSGAKCETGIGLRTLCALVSFFHCTL